MNDFDRILDDCIDRMGRGHSIEDCLTRYQEHAHQLEPLLRAAGAAQLGFQYQPSAAERQQAWASLERALAERRSCRIESARRSLFHRLVPSRPLPVAVIASLAVVGLTALLIVWPAISSHTPTPPQTPPETSEPTADDPPAPPGDADPTPGDETTPDPPVGAVTTLSAREDGNFVFYLSDEPNAIGDFSSLVITASSVILKPHGEGPWLSFDLSQQTADLVQLQGNRALEMWRGDVPEGEYTNVFLHIEHVEGMLAATGETIMLKLPSGRLHLNMTFEVLAGEVTEFVFDITVRRAGPPGTTSYLLLPQASDSGTGRPIDRVEEHGPPPDRGAHTPGRPDPRRDGIRPPSINRRQPERLSRNATMARTNATTLLTRTAPTRYKDCGNASSW